MKRGKQFSESCKSVSRRSPHVLYGSSLHVSAEHVSETGTAEQEQMAKRGRNELKREALAIFENRGWLNVPVWAALARYYPVRSAYPVLTRLHRWKLLERRPDQRGLLLYRISQRARDRLAWLRRAGT